MRVKSPKLFTVLVIPNHERALVGTCPTTPTRLVFTSFLVFKRNLTCTSPIFSQHFCSVITVATDANQLNSTPQLRMPTRDSVRALCACSRCFSTCSTKPRGFIIARGQKPLSCVHLYLRTLTDHGYQN